MASRSSLSARSKVKYGRPGIGSSVKQKIIPVNKTAAQRVAAQKVYDDTIAGLSFVQREEMLNLQDDQDMPYAYSQDDWFEPGGNDHDDWEDLVLLTGVHTFPLGEEAVLQSHAGSEAIMHQIMEGMRPGRGDPRTRSFHVQKEVDMWQSQLPLLVDAYLQFKDRGVEEIEGQWPLNCVGFNESGPRLFSHPPDVIRSNQTLMRQGYIGGSPQKPAIAFSLRTFEIYRQIHRVCPRYTIDSLAKTLNHLHKVPRKAYLAEQLTTAYDAYLAIQREVDARVQRALGRDTTWDWKNICPPCFYKVKDELPLKFSYLASLDGNNSLKLVDSMFCAGHPRFDNRASTSFCWLTPSEVDNYQDEVKRSSKVPMTTAAAMAAVAASLAGATPVATPSTSSTTPHPDQGDVTNASPTSNDFPDGPADNVPDGETPDVDGDIAWLNVNELNDEDADSLQKCVNTCVERWKAAGPEARKKMFALFAISGIFISVCRHGHVLVMCDMIRSGELMKYPLAICAKIFERYGADAGIGSLGRKTVGLRMRGIVPAFHGHAHNRMCQIGWHPMYVDGAGLEDFEECERIFCLSNNLTSCTRLATPFHRQQQIDEHFYFHDQNKHAASGNFIFQNYRQAVEKITTNKLKLKVLEEQLHTTAANYEQDLRDERTHLESLLREPAEVQKTVDYIELLAKLQVATAAERDFRNLNALIILNKIQGRAITNIRTRYRTTFTRLSLVEEEVSRFEVENGYEVRWTTGSKEYNDALVLMNEHRYRRTINKLERLVVQRLLELTKLSMSSVAYKLRDKIGKALKSHADAIHRALNEYNAAAASLNPPRDQLIWAQVIQTVSLAEFDLLRDTRNDIRRLPWTQPARREAGLLYFGIKRAKEEIRRLNIEITRIITFAVDEHADFHQAIAANILTNPPLARELSERWKFKARINESIVERFVKASRLPGFSGTLFPGKRLGRDPSSTLAYPLPSWATDTLGLSQVVVEYEEDNDLGDTARELEGLDTDNMIQLMDSLEIVELDEL
ncbi:hypothetical protein DFH08DRAFT_1012260 [Mycena albidolilacea]|uniref:CxC1-like cysteine cluster associated with KDZ transposases domain-containing protein n=1 Tax=Mycena albidolilacea TaxID=1033008 RepID=A0AAD6ZVQ8_9AGAR|nr:hypothetical protein DFH08DRAFT_1012260 [Mycena albidolilacea]